MYAIRARALDGVVEARFSGHVAPEEALRAVSQAFALAEAGEIHRGLCDLRQVSHRAGNTIVLGAAFASRFTQEHRVALICDRRQLSLCRRLTRLAGYGERLGVFTREVDAEAWVASVQRIAPSETALRHVMSDQALPAHAVEPKTKVGAA